ncbi:ion transporter [Limosilactobacillus reuteri]|uniref:Ion transporter n=2 Tax=Limosilactobacillus reuteri TaxID=1598 RepID=A0A1C2GFB1_LIMRT|nr:ion transporter [Limosilactobacillus reuteri]
MALLAIISIVLIVLDYAHEINIISPPYSIIDNSILIIFAIDYFVRLFYAKDKKRFFKENIFDLLSIIPVNNLFYVFRMARIGRAFRLLKLLRIFRLVGLTGRLHKFLKTNGLVYYLYISLTVILIASSLYCISEKVSFGTALWWSITTATTVGYGDVSPTTGLGKAAAVLLMFLGIGFIGMLTSSLTNFFDTSTDNDLEKELAELKQQNKELEDHLSRLEKLVKENK